MGSLRLITFKVELNHVVASNQQEKTYVKEKENTYDTQDGNVSTLQEMPQGTAWWPIAPRVRSHRSRMDKDRSSAVVQEARDEHHACRL